MQKPWASCLSMIVVAILLVSVMGLVGLYYFVNTGHVVQGIKHSQHYEHIGDAAIKIPSKVASILETSRCCRNVVFQVDQMAFSTWHGVNGFWGYDSRAHCIGIVDGQLYRFSILIDGRSNSSVHEGQYFRIDRAAKSIRRIQCGDALLLSQLSMESIQDSDRIELDLVCKFLSPVENTEPTVILQ